MDELVVPHNALVLVGDGRKAQFLRNVGTPRHPKLVVERLFQHDSLPTRDLGTDRPGRYTFAPAGGARSAMEETDWHQLEEQRFVHAVAEALRRAALADAAVQLVVILAPKALGDLRAAMDKQLAKHVIAEIPRDLTGHPLKDIEKHIALRTDE